MESFADYILEERNLASKMEIAYYLSKKTKVLFDKAIVFKTELLRLFLNYSKIEVDKNYIITACLLCNCKKVENAQDLDRVHAYAKDGANYLEEIGFNKRFCKICEEINRYSKSNPREKESDILELVDQFGGMLLSRPERIGFKPDEALVLLEHRNLKDYYNRYLGTFIDFINFMEEIMFKDITSMSALRRLVKIYNETEDLKKFIQKVIFEYEPEIDRLMEKQAAENAIGMFKNLDNPNRPLFSEATTKKIMDKIANSEAKDETIA